MSSGKNIGPPPQAFGIGLSNIFDVMSTTLNVMYSFFAGGLFVYGFNFLNVFTVSPFKNKEQYALQLGPLPLYMKEETFPGTIDKLHRPSKPLILYEFEACPFCRKVRETINYLNIDAQFYPCPKEGKKWRQEIIKKTGKSQFPFMIDPNNGKEIQDSDLIIKYLFNEYGPGEAKIPIILKLGKLTVQLAYLANYFRRNKGLHSQSNIIPTEKIVVYQFQGSPFCKSVREAFSELEIPYLQISVARGSPTKQVVYKKFGRFQAPMVEFPDKDQFIYESSYIVNYLHKTYGKKAQ